MGEIKLSKDMQKRIRRVFNEGFEATFDRKPTDEDYTKGQLASEKQQAYFKTKEGKEQIAEEEGELKEKGLIAVKSTKKEKGFPKSTTEEKKRDFAEVYGGAVFDNNVGKKFKG